MAVGSDPKVVRFPRAEGGARDQLLLDIITEHDGALRRFLRMRQLSAADLEDVVQDVYLKLSRLDDPVERFSKSPDSIRSYLFVMASNVIRDQARKAKARDAGRHRTFEEGASPINVITPDTIVDGQQRLRAVWQVLRRQKPAHRRAFLLSRFDNLSYRQIADELGISVSTVEKHISRVLLALRRELAK